MECSNIMGGGVPTQSSGKISVRICHYIIFSYSLGHYLSSRLNPSSTASPSSPNRIPVCYHHHKSAGQQRPRSSTTVMSKNCPCGYVLVHGVLVLGNVDANSLQTHFHQPLPNQRIFPSSVPHLLRNLARDPECLLMM